MKWHRYRTSSGTIYYTANISDTIMLHIWQEGRLWHWIVAGWPSPSGGPKVFRFGRAKTLRAATAQVESLLPKNEEQLVWMNI